MNYYDYLKRCMKISVDGGSLSSTQNKQFGNYTFSNQLIHFLGLYDQQNSYTIYTQQETSLSIRDNFQVRHLRPKLGWMKIGIGLAELIAPKDIFLALNQAIPLFTSAKIFTFSHGLSFEFFPKLYEVDYARLHTQLLQYMQKSSVIITSSIRVENELKQLFPHIQIPIHTILFGLPEKIAETDQTIHVSGNPLMNYPYFLFVGMHHPIKNIRWLIDTFNQYIAKTGSNAKLVLIGPHQQFSSQQVIVVNGYSSQQIGIWYQNASAYLTASLYESFNFPVAEALTRGCPVIGLETAIIPEMRQFCHIANTQHEFVDLMDSVVNSNNRFTQSVELSKLLNWKSYVNKLTALYN